MATVWRPATPGWAAIRSLFRFAALRHPEHAAVIERVRAIPPKRFDRALIDYLTDPEVDAAPTSPATAKNARTASPR